MLDDDKRGARRAQAGEQREELATPGGIEIGRRLVEKPKLRFQGQHRSDGEPLLLTARERRRIAAFEAAEADGVERLVDSSAHRSWIDAELLEPEHHFLLHARREQLRLEILKDEADAIGQIPHVQPVGGAAEHAQRAADLGRLQGRHDAVRALEKRRLPRAARPDDRDHLAALDPQRDVAQRRRGCFRVAHVDAFERQRLFAHRERKHVKAPTMNGSRPTPISNARLGEEMPNTFTQGGVQKPA